MVQVETRTESEVQVSTVKGDNDGELIVQAEIESGVKIHRAKDAEYETIGGFMFQRCGGGRRVIRRSKGSY